MTFLGKSFSEWNKVKKPIVVPTSYEGSHNDEVKTDFGYNNNYFNVVSNYKNNDEEEEHF